MIVKMKKVYLLVQGKDSVSAVNTLGELGSVHVEHLKAPSGVQVNLLKEEIRLLEKAIHILPKPTGQHHSLSAQQWEEKAREITGLQERTNTLAEAMVKRQIQLNAYEPWGDFSLEDIKSLQGREVYIRLCHVPAKGLKNPPPGVILKEISKAKGFSRCLAVSRKDVELPFETVALPSVSLGELKSRQKKDEQELADIEKKISELSFLKPALEEVFKEKCVTLRFQEALSGMEQTDEIAYLKGFCPQDQCAKLERQAKENHWGVLIEDPGEDDHVPTLLRNPKGVDLSKPALDMIEVLPGYREVDVSPVFIVFFTLFFGMLIGDAAYGAIFALATFIAQRKFKGKVQSQKPFHLAYLLTGFTVIWGILTGTYFGQEWLPSTVDALVPWLNDNNNVQWLCFTIALAHLSIARLWRFKSKFPELTALSEIGWLFIVWGMYFLANMFVLNKPFPEFASWFFMIGIPLALFFMVHPKDFFKKVPQELIPFVLGIIGSGTDIISYIRLFAVGLATVAVADAANFMPQALPLGVGYFFLVLLHMINMVLALMAILVHAIRLNLLEFSGHLGLLWSGFKYEPLKKMKQA